MDAASQNIIQKLSRQTMFPFPGTVLAKLHLSVNFCYATTGKLTRRPQCG